MEALPLEAQAHFWEEPLQTEVVPFPDRSPFRDRHSGAVWPIWGLVRFQEHSGSPDQCCSEEESASGMEASVLRGDPARVA